MDNISLIQIITLLALCSFAFYLGWLVARRRAASILKNIEKLMHNPGALEEASDHADWEQNPVCLRAEPFIIISNGWWLSSISCGCKLQLQHNGENLLEPAVQAWIIQKKCAKKEVQGIIAMAEDLAESMEELLSATGVPHKMKALNIIEK
jgi:hypothetical protein